MFLLEEENKCGPEEFNVRIVKCAEPILIGDESKTEEENKILRASGYPSGYNDQLDLVFPPEEWEENGKTWRRVASTKPLNRKEMSILSKELLSQMERRQTNDQGQCPIGKEPHIRYLDELIRQVCISNIDLGELLIRIRDELKFTIKTYENIFRDSSSMFHTKKSVTNGQDANKLQNDEKEMKKLEDAKHFLKKKLNEAKRNLQYLKEYNAEELKTLKATNNDELNFFKKNHEAIKKQYNAIDK